MNSYALVLTILGGVVLFCESIFLLLFRPHWRVLGLWWINVALYAQSIALAAGGLRILLIYRDRLHVASTLSDNDQVVSLLLTLLMAFGTVAFLVGYLLNRDWGMFPRGREKERRLKPRRKSDH